MLSWRRALPPAMLADTAVRLAVPADAGAIAAMSRDYIEHGLPWSWLPARVERAIHNPDTNVAMVDAAGTPGGAARRKAMYSGTLDGVLLEKWLVADSSGTGR